MAGDLSTILDSIGKTVDHLTEAQKNLVVGHEKLLENQMAISQQVATIANNLSALTQYVETLTLHVGTLLSPPPDEPE